MHIHHAHSGNFYQEIAVGMGLAVEILTIFERV